MNHEAPHYAVFSSFLSTCPFISVLANLWQVAFTAVPLFMSVGRPPSLYCEQYLYTAPRDAVRPAGVTVPSALVELARFY